MTMPILSKGRSRGRHHRSRRASGRLSFSTCFHEDAPQNPRERQQIRQAAQLRRDLAGLRPPFC